MGKGVGLALVAVLAAAVADTANALVLNSDRLVLSTNPWGGGGRGWAARRGGAKESASARQALKAVPPEGGEEANSPQEDPFWGLCPDEGGLDPRRFVRVSTVGIRRVDQGAVLTCAVEPGQQVLQELTEYFPLFLGSKVTASVFHELGSHTLPDVLASLPNVAQCDLVQIGIKNLESLKCERCDSAVFVVVDESNSDKPPFHVVELGTTVGVALGLSVKQLEPFYISASALLSANAEFVDRAAMDPRVGPGHDSPTRGWLPHQVQVIEGLQSDLRDLDDRIRLAEAWLERAKEGESASALAVAAEARQEVEADIWAALPDIIERCNKLYSKRMKLFFSANEGGHQAGTGKAPPLSDSRGPLTSSG